MENANTSLYAEVLKVDDDLGLVMGIAIVCTKNGEPYYDLQDDYIPEDVMLEAAVDFMDSERVAGEMHVAGEDGTIEKRGSVTFCFPLTADIAKAFEIEADYTGLLVAVKPDEDMLAKFKDGTLKGFSIGGKCAY